MSRNSGFKYEETDASPHKILQYVHNSRVGELGQYYCWTCKEISEIRSTITGEHKKLDGSAWLPHIVKGDPSTGQLRLIKDYLETKNEIRVTNDNGIYYQLEIIETQGDTP